MPNTSQQSEDARRSARHDIGGVHIACEIGYRGEFGDGLWFTMKLELLAGRYICTRMRLDAAPELERGITSEILRELPVARIITEVARDKTAEDTLRRYGERILGDDATIAEEILALVAACYRYGFAVSESPTRWVMELLNVERHKASRWIAQARESGHLGDMAARRPGGSGGALEKALAYKARLEAEIEQSRLEIAAADVRVREAQQASEDAEQAREAAAVAAAAAMAARDELRDAEGYRDAMIERVQSAELRYSRAMEEIDRLSGGPEKG